MKIRGDRRCKDCGQRWAYYDTGSVACPECGSLRSVGVDERKQHTANPVTLDLTRHHEALDSGTVAKEADPLKRALREYIHRRGFIHTGELIDLDDTYLAVHEFLHAIDVYARRRTATDAERLYLHTLLRNAESKSRPDESEVPESMTAARGLAYADAVDAYRREVSTWLDEHPNPEARKALGVVAEHARRVHALNGSVPLDESEALVLATKDVASALRTGDESALETATLRFGDLDGIDDIDVE